ncbi:MAG: cell wall-binding repeat-containing protein, partial [Eggerthellaceae bacterium]|nr:cell wall-binding repeat-containing protein [Eggerthellaceae bacterium]
MTKTNWMEKALAIFAAACAMVACLAIAEAPAFAAQDNVAEAQQGAAASAAGTSVEPAEGTAVAPAATVAAPAPISAAAQVGANQPRGGAQDATGVSGASQPAATVEEKPAAADGQATAQAADATAATPAASGAGSQQSAEQGSAKADKSPEAGAAAKATEAAAGADKKDGAATASSDAKAGASKASSQEEASKNKRVDAQSKDAASGAAAKDREAKDNAAATADASKDAASKSDAAKDAATKEVSNSSDAASKSSAQASAAKDDNKAAATNDAAASKDATAAVASTQALTVSSQSASSSQDVTGWLRLYGQTALDTMAKVVQTGFDTSEAAVLATNSTYLDALSASPLAGMLKAPILLTDKSALSPQTASELARMKTKKVYIVGGRMAVSLNVGEQLLARGLQVERIAGANAAGTAEEVARKIGSAAGDTCIVATSSSFADALSIAPYAYSHVAPIFLSDKKKGLAGTTTSLIKQSDFDHAVIVGGELAVPKNVESQVSSAGVQDVVRLAGANAYKTNAEVASWCLKQGMRRERMTVATAKNYQDALSGAALSGKNNSILLLADDGDRSSISRHFRPYVSLVKRGYILGGPLAVSSITREYLLQPAGSTTLISSARTIADGLYSLLPAANTAFTVEVANGLLSKDAAVSLFAKNNTFAQKWQIVWTGRGYYIRNLGSGLVLGTKGNSTAPGASVVQRGYSNVDDVLWSIAKTASGSVTIRSLKSGMALDITRAAYANGTTINIRTPNGTAAQRFAVRSTESLVDGAVYSIFLAANGRVMDVPGGTGTYATQMQLYDYNGSPAQKFVARRVEAGVYALQSLASGLYLQDYNGGNVVQGPKVANAKSQQWFVRPGLFGAMLANKATDRVLTTWGDNTGNGARLVTRAVQSKLNQQYRIGFVAPIDNGIYTIYNMKGGRALSVVDPVFSNGSNITT